MKRFGNRMFFLGWVALLLAIPLGVALWGHRDTDSYYENRTLAQRPALRAETLWNGTFGTEFEKWFSDHTPGRTTLLKLDTAVQMDWLRRPVVHEIVLDAGEVLVPLMDFDEYTAEEYRENADPIAENFGKLNEQIRACGGRFVYVGLPEQRVYFEDAFPSYLNSHKEEAERADAIFAEALAARGVDFLDMRKVYAAQGNPAEYYSAVDHHYTYYGAYAAYRAVMEHLTAGGEDLPVLTEEELEFWEVPNPYIGSRNRKLYNLWEHTERAVIGVQKMPVAFLRTDNGEPTQRPLFVLPVQEQLPTTYNLYMGGDFAETILETQRPELPDALIFGDSFSNAMETLLYASFDETRILDLRHYTEKSLREYIEEYRPDYVLCIMNDTFYYTTTGNGNVWEDLKES